MAVKHNSVRSVKVLLERNRKGFFRSNQRNETSYEFNPSRSEDRMELDNLYDDYRENFGDFLEKKQKQKSYFDKLDNS